MVKFPDSEFDDGTFSVSGVVNPRGRTDRPTQLGKKHG